MKYLKVKKYIPRAIYYMKFWTPFFSLIELLKPNWNNKTENINIFKNKLIKLLDINEVFFIPHARFGLYFILKFLNFPAGSKILMTPINIPEMLKMIRLNNLEPYYVGYKENSFEIDFKSLEIPKDVKSFLYTPLAGIHIDMNELLLFCNKNNLVLIQDLTQSFTGKVLNKFIHNYSDFSFASFCDLKTLHTHRGGVILTANRDFIKFLNTETSDWFTLASFKYFFGFIIEDLLASLFLRQSIFHYIGSKISILSNKYGNFLEELSSGNGLKIGKFKLATSFMSSGNDWSTNTIDKNQKYHYTDFQARIGIERLNNFQYREENRIKNTNLFYENLSLQARKLKPFINKNFSPLYWKAPLLIKDVKKFQNYMLTKKIDVARSNLPWLPDLYNPFKQIISGSNMKENCVYIPLHYYLSNEDILAIASAVNEYVEKNLF